MGFFKRETLHIDHVAYSEFTFIIYSHALRNSDFVVSVQVRSKRPHSKPLLGNRFSSDSSRGDGFENADLHCNP